KSGYKGVGPVCWQSCPDGYRDDGAFCRKDVDIYGKGCCCVFGNCCNNCKAGYKDDGCTCRRDAHIFAKQSYGRGVGKAIDIGAKIREGFERAMLALADSLLKTIEPLLKDQIDDAIAKATQALGFNQDDAIQIVEPSGKIREDVLHRVVIDKLIHNHV